MLAAASSCDVCVYSIHVAYFTQDSGFTKRSSSPTSMISFTEVKSQFEFAASLFICLCVTPCYHGNQHSMASWDTYTPILLYNILFMFIYIYHTKNLDTQ